MRKRKVLFFADGLYGGGAERVLQTVLKYLDKDLFDITLYSVKEETLNDLYPCNINYQYIFHSWNQNDGILMRLKKKIVNKFKLWIYYHLSPTVFYFLFVKGKYDVEVAFIEGYATRIVSGSTNKESKKIAWVHIDLEKNHWTPIAYRNTNEEKQCYSRYDTVVGVSQSVMKVNERLFPDIKKNIYIYNPVDAQYILHKAEINVNINRKAKVFKLVTCGRLVLQKGYVRLIEVIEKLIKEGYELNLIIIGGGPEEVLLRDKIKEFGLEQKIVLTGFLDNPYPVMKQADCFICSSYAEGFSLVILEAMVLGIPVISTNCSGPNELIQNSQYGILVENSFNGIYDGLKRVLEHPELLEFYKKMAFERGNDFSMYKVLALIEQLLKTG